MNRRFVLALIAAVLIIFGLVQGFESRGSLCGSVFKPSDAASFYDTLSGSPGGEAAACRQSISDGKPLTYGALGLGAVAVLLAIVVGGEPARKPNVSDAGT